MDELDVLSSFEHGANSLLGPYDNDCFLFEDPLGSASFDGPLAFNGLLANPAPIRDNAQPSLEVSSACTHQLNRAHLHDLLARSPS